MDDKLGSLMERLGHQDALSWPSVRASKESAWHGHVSFAHWLVQAATPGLIVELGSHNGVSYAAFCSSAQRSDLSTRCLAVDSWEGDDHAGHYGEDVYTDLFRFNKTHYQGFSTLLRCYFDVALCFVRDGSVDLLHIDGLHTYEAVKHDFDTWLPKLSSRATVLFHDTEVREREFGVWKIWEELSQIYPSFNFRHSAGLGVLAVGQNVPAPVRFLCHSTAMGHDDAIRQQFAEASNQAYLVGRETTQTQRDVARQGSIPGRRNVALDCVAIQSSSFEGGEPTPSGAVNGVRNGRFGFHTSLELDPWWMVDLGSRTVLSDIVVFNRLDNDCSGRAASLCISLSNDGVSWDELYMHDGSTFGGVDGKPLVVTCDRAVARFVRLVLNDYQYLHLDEVEVYGHE